ncbi:MAG TPA: flagellar basal body rod protein FlgB [Accumulibacter sp.]|nr:flagellar basal body rod protein FlgB [Accumulibacter sp.]
MLNKLDRLFSLQQQALPLRAQRQQVLASNIANADTPNYLARDFDFSAALQHAVAGRGQDSVALTRTSPRHLSGTADSPVRLAYRQPLQASADGNTVEMDVERGLFAENSLFYEAGTTFLTHQVKSMLAAVQP